MPGVAARSTADTGPLAPRLDSQTRVWYSTRRRKGKIPHNIPLRTVLCVSRHVTVPPGGHVERRHWIGIYTLSRRALISNTFWPS